MPALIGVSEFVDEAVDDYNSPTTSTFVSKMPQCRQTISCFEDVSSFFLFICEKINLSTTHKPFDSIFCYLHFAVIISRVCVCV